MPIIEMQDEISIDRLTLEYLKKLEKICQPNLLDVRRYGLTILHLVAKYAVDDSTAVQCLEFLKTCQMNAAFVDMRGSDAEHQRTALSMAMQTGKLELFKNLLILGANPNVPDMEGNTVLHQAILTGHAQVYVEMLLRGFGSRYCGLIGGYRPNTSVEVVNHQGLRPLHLASQIGDVNAVQLLLDQSASPDVVDPAGRTPLHLAVLANHSEIVEFLLNKNADISLRDLTGHTAWDEAYLSRNLGVIKRFIEIKKREDLVQISPAHRSLLHLAVQFEMEPLVRQEIKQLHAVDDKGRSALHLACGRGQANTNIVRLLLNSGAKIDLEDRNGLTPLAYAACSKRSTLARLEQLIPIFRAQRKSVWRWSRSELWSQVRPEAYKEKIRRRMRTAIAMEHVRAVKFCLKLLYGHEDISNPAILFFRWKNDFVEVRQEAPAAGVIAEIH